MLGTTSVSSAVMTVNSDRRRTLAARHPPPSQTPDDNSDDEYPAMVLEDRDVPDLIEDLGISTLMQTDLADVDVVDDAPQWLTQVANSCLEQSPACSAINNSKWEHIATLVPNSAMTPTCTTTTHATNGVVLQRTELSYVDTELLQAVQAIAVHQSFAWHTVEGKPPPNPKTKSVRNNPSSGVAGLALNWGVANSCRIFVALPKQRTELRRLAQYSNDGGDTFDSQPRPALAIRF
jgi:hypothetical protein